MRFQSKEEAQKAHIDNYRSDGVLKQYGNPNQSNYYRVLYFVDQVKPDSKVLDVGCNGGSLGVHLLSKGCHVNGIDIVKELVEKAKRRGIYAQEGQAEDLSMFKDESFDYVLCGEVLEHLYDPYEAVKEAHRVLKPGGKYIISVPHISGFMGGDKLGDYHHQNFSLEMLDTLIYTYFERDQARFVEIPYCEAYNLANGIKPIGKDDEGNLLFPPQWIGITATKTGIETSCKKCGVPWLLERKEDQDEFCSICAEKEGSK